MDTCTGLWGSLISETDVPRILIDDAKKELCLELSTQLTCDDVLPEECMRGRWMMGGADAGEACERHQDCISGQGGDATCVEGLCHQNPRGRLGEVCRASVDDTGQRTTYSVDDEWSELVAAECFRSDGLYCAGPSGCQPVHRLGGPCENSSQCDVSSVCEAGGCAEPPPLGTACSITVDCGAEARCEQSCVALSEYGEPCESCSFRIGARVDEIEMTCDPGTGLDLCEQGVCGFSVYSAPKDLHILLRRDDARLVDADISPTYLTEMPNGPGCIPHCKRASVNVTWNDAGGRVWQDAVWP